LITDLTLASERAVMPKKTSTSKRKSKPKQSKADFVRSQPSDMPASEVIAKAKAAGMSLNEDTVYKTRSLDKVRAKKKAGAKKRAASEGTKPRGRSPDKKQRILELVEQHPEWTAQQVAKAAKSSTAHVYSVWGGSKKRGGSANGTAKPKSPVMQHLDHVRALRGVILHVGIDRAKEMMDQIVKDLMVLA
jgi:hypothetical protein